jgi:hypothetical protein
MPRNLDETVLYVHEFGFSATLHSKKVQTIVLSRCNKDAHIYSGCLLCRLNIFHMYVYSKMHTNSVSYTPSMGLSYYIRDTNPNLNIIHIYIYYLFQQTTLSFEASLFYFLKVLLA